VQVDDYHLAEVATYSVSGVVSPSATLACAGCKLAWGLRYRSTPTPARSACCGAGLYNRYALDFSWHELTVRCTAASPSAVRGSFCRAPRTVPNSRLSIALILRESGVPVRIAIRSWLTCGAWAPKELEDVRVDVSWGLQLRQVLAECADYFGQTRHRLALDVDKYSAQRAGRHQLEPICRILESICGIRMRWMPRRSCQGTRSAVTLSALQLARRSLCARRHRKVTSSQANWGCARRHLHIR